MRKRVDKPRRTVDRELQALHMLGLVTLREEQTGASNRWYHSIAPAVDTAALFPEKDLPPNPWTKSAPPQP